MVIDSFLGFSVDGALHSPIFLEQRLLSSGSGLFALLSDDFEQIFGQIVSTTEKTLSNTNLEASRHIKRE